jgi:sugar phosphate permease
MTPAPVPSSPAPAQPTRVRYRVAGLTYLLAMIVYLDRVCLATLAPRISSEFVLTKVQMGYVFSAFALAYAIFEIPTARVADRLGTRDVLTRIVIWWSAFTMLTGAAFNYVSLLAARFLFGAGEAGAWPCSARVFASWIPRRERGTAQSFFFSAAFLSGALTPFVVTLLLQHISWRWVLVTFGTLGLLWAAAWHRWFRSEPSEHPDVNAAERDLIAAGGGAAPGHAGGGKFWRQIILNRNVLALCLMYFPNSCVFYFCITWLPTYLKERHNFTALSVDVFTGLPLLLSVFSVIIGGFTMDRIASLAAFVSVGEPDAPPMVMKIGFMALLTSPTTKSLPPAPPAPPLLPRADTLRLSDDAPPPRASSTFFCCAALRASAALRDSSVHRIVISARMTVTM